MICHCIFIGSYKKILFFQVQKPVLQTACAPEDLNSSVATIPTGIASSVQLPMVQRGTAVATTNIVSAGVVTGKWKSVVFLKVPSQEFYIRLGYFGYKAATEV